MPDILTIFTLSKSIRFIHWLFSRWQVVQASLTSEGQPCFLPADDLELCPHQLGRDESVCALRQAQQNANRRQRTPKERHLPGGRGGAGQVNSNKPTLTWIYQWLILGHSLMDEGQFQKCNFKGATWWAELTSICAQCTICSYHGNPPKHTGRLQAAPLHCRKETLPPAGKALKAAEAPWYTS